MIDLTSNINNVEDLWGDIDANLTIFIDNALKDFIPELIEIFNNNYIHFYIESFPSIILFKQIFNEKIKVGNLILSRPPKIVVLPSNYVRTLKEWDVLLLKRGYVKVKMFMVTEKENICEPLSIVVPNPQYYTIGNLFLDIYSARCKTENKIIFANEMKEVYNMLRSGKVEAGIMWEHEARLNNFNGIGINKTNILEIGVFKGADKNVINAYNIMNSEYFKKVLATSLEIISE